MTYMSGLYRKTVSLLPFYSTERLGLDNRSTVLTIGFVLIILATNHVMANLPNVKLFDLLVLSSGYVLGFRRGMLVAASAWIVYGTFNPWGAADPLLLTVLMCSETIYAFAGSMLRSLLKPCELNFTGSRQIVLLIFIAFTSTVFYDMVTNIYTGLAWAGLAGSSEYWYWLRMALFNPGALLFSMVHVSSNIFLFVTLGPIVIKTGMFINGFVRDRVPVDPD